MNRAISTLFLALLSSFCPLFGQNADENRDSTQKKLEFAVLPVVYVTPETGLALGAGASVAFDIKDAVHPSNVLIGAVYTLRKQFLAYLPFELYLKEDKYRMKGEVGYYDYVFEYYGIGDRPNERELYDARFPRMRFALLRKIRANVFVGFDSQIDYFENSNFEVTGELIKQRPIGYAGGLVALIGPMLQWDTRDDVYWCTKGLFFETKMRFSNNAWGSDYNYNLFQTDFRYFKSFGKSIIAAQLYQRTAKGEVPFYLMPLLGGNKWLRGYYEGYLRYNVFLSTQIELRRHLFWRISGAAFIGVGTTSENWKTISNKVYWPSYGAGIRFALLKEKKINLRLDYAFGRDNSAFYLTFGEAF